MNNQKAPHAFFATLGVIGISVLVFLFTFGTITQNKIPQTNSFAAEKKANVMAADPRESTDRSKSVEHVKLIENLRTQNTKTNLQKSTTLQTQSVAQSLTVGTSAPALPDLSVIYISRTPRYYRYCLTYPNNVPQLCPGTENQKRWPDVGELVTYNAHITNNGENFTGNIHFEWLVDGQVVSSGDKSDAFEKHFDFEFSQYSMPWTTEHHQVEFRINIIDSAVTEVSTANNKLAIGSHDLTISYWVESGQYIAFNNLQNSLGTYSFEDWMNLHIKTLNQRLRDAKFSNVPNGVTDQVRIDKFVIADELDGSNTPRSNDADLYLIDGRWQSTDGDSSNARGQNGFYNEYANQYVATIDWGLIHELTHQLGAIDLYMMNIPEAPPNNGLQMYDVNGALVTRSRFPYSGLNFPNYDLMGGGDITPYTDHTMYSFHTAAGLQSDAGHRRGYFGEYLFDTPDTTVLQILDTNGQPVSNAQVDLFQRDPFTEIFDNVAEFSVVTDGSGYAVLANRPAPSVTTITGHTEKPNPFGQIYVWGAGGMMATRVIKNNQDGYAFLLLHDLNIAYWKGQKQVAIVPVKTNFPAANPSPTPTVTPTLTPIPSPTSTLTPTLTPTITKTPTPSPTRTPTPKPTRTPTPTPDTTGPSVSITSPLNNSYVTHSNSTTIRVSASDPSGISKVQFYVNDSLKCTDSSSSYTCKWSVPSKRGVVYIIKAKAIDKKNNSSSTQIAVTSN